MQLPEIQMLFNEGILKDAYIIKILDTYILYFTKGHNEHVTLEKQRGGVRLFKTIDSAIALVKTIGFKRAIVEW